MIKCLIREVTAPWNTLKQSKLKSPVQVPDAYSFSLFLTHGFRRLTFNILSSFQGLLYKTRFLKDVLSEITTCAPEWNRQKAFKSFPKAFETMTREYRK